MKRATVLSMCVVLTFASVCFARGMLIPKDTSLPPLAIKSHRVSVEIDSQLAVTKVEQVFQNNTDRVLEATYIFPLPPGATINDFAMYINGKRMSGQLVERTQARQIYTDIVRRMKDPGLLEYLGGNLFKLNIFPIPANGTQRLEVQYSEVLTRDSGMHRYVYPLKTEEPASKTMEDFTVSMTIKSREPISNIYSPSHKIGITRKNDHEAVLGFEHDAAVLDHDVVVYYTVSDGAFGVNLMTTRPDKARDGYFMLLVTPKPYFKADEILPRDVCFVLDTSGSMQTDDKLKQAQEALKYCVNSLNARDRFTVIAFSTGVNPMSKELLDATDENKTQALAFIDKQEAMGGTAIHAALVQAVFMKRADETERPYTVVFLTDGRPTVGEDRNEEIVKAVSGAANVRIFTWGVGTDVNTHLLDLVAEKTRAVSEYVQPREGIEQKVSLFFNKMSKPVLSSPEIDWGKMKVANVYPTQLPDLFAGQQVTVFGRYEGTGDAAITLVGNIRGKKTAQTFEATYGDAPGNSFIEKLWASRHVGFLLDEIRLRGEKAELKEEVIALSRKYGIQTPYTSYLVLETEEEYKRHGIATGGGPGVAGAATRSGRMAWRGVAGDVGVGAAEAPARTADFETLRKKMEKDSKEVAEGRDRWAGVTGAANKPV
ncbi:MAG TPA: VIT domain-containing protein, partial [Planctomycetota bacterium]|nr:VIT domain-containing protein [Planctomycetota bacterium]